MGIREVPKEMTVGSSIGPTASEHGCVSWKEGEIRVIENLSPVLHHPGFLYEQNRKRKAGRIK